MTSHTNYYDNMTNDNLVLIKHNLQSEKWALWGKIKQVEDIIKCFDDSISYLDEAYSKMNEAEKNFKNGGYYSNGKAFKQDAIVKITNKIKSSKEKYGSLKSKFNAELEKLNSSYNSLNEQLYYVNDQINIKTKF